ncbi:lipocalin family protein [Galbibacter sp. EGI 63066]|uniref:lipocalin family protein n=1 Tax=Galbibacter sp. EGI 63066 TaxID=2993559 RepID=UPI00224906DD|nr:lipocalin family protein [Galbibacter sp. EGI 63066]MCX2678930.1 lipocalin family protein [Galbibacter sp. EGI 63066]
MKPKTLFFVLLGLAFLMPVQQTEAQFLKKLGKKARKAAERGVENTVERKAEQKAEEKTDQAIETVFGVPKKVIDKDETTTEVNNFEGTWYYESLEGVPGYENLNDCGKKSNITYSGGSYRTQFYDNDCNLLTDDTGSYQIEGNIMTVKAQAQDEVSTTKVTTTQTILEHTETKLVIEDAMTGAVVTLVRRGE